MRVPPGNGPKFVTPIPFNRMGMRGERKVEHIILADDDFDEHLMFRDALRDVAPECKFTEIENGQELLKLLESFVPDMLFLDLDMPRKNGLECLIQIRSQQHLQALPVIVYSSTNKVHNIDVAYEMGANLFIPKPSAYKEIHAALLKIFSLDWTNPSTIRQQYSEGDQKEEREEA